MFKRVLLSGSHLLRKRVPIQVLRMPLVQTRPFSDINTADTEKILLNKMRYEDEIQLVLTKLATAVSMIQDDPSSKDRI